MAFIEWLFSRSLMVFIELRVGRNIGGTNNFYIVYMHAGHI